MENNRHSINDAIRVYKLRADNTRVVTLPILMFTDCCDHLAFNESHDVDVVGVIVLVKVFSLQAIRNHQVLPKDHRLDVNAK